jgi:hypothetical protein
MAWDPRTRRQLAEYAYGILAIATIPVVAGGLVSRHLGAEMWLVGMGLGAYVSVCAVILIIGDLAIQRVIDWWERSRLVCASSSTAKRKQG